ncbi:Aste57867_11575 [Aphanomyces stellatus]|uniref:Aste57867_11575 protein n=1 Tax=Aphanomyces stellatus TaxID=120398 RepID=A0A485KTC7_9STRA|nr:hypothetical protein As57867_011532 [Aphanomyces stellatus]VFT88434.1 Aste57867_11575 [Aphanomyces stellatus]
MTGEAEDEVAAVLCCLVACVDDLGASPRLVILEDKDDDDIQQVVLALSSAVAVGSTTVGAAFSLAELFAMTSAIVFQGNTPQSEEAIVAHMSRETFELIRLQRSCIQGVRRDRLLRLVESSNQLMHHPTTLLAPWPELALEARWTDTGDAIYAKTNVLGDAFAPLKRCRQYAKQRALSDAAIYQALRRRVRNLIACREVNRIAKLNQQKLHAVAAAHGWDQHIEEDADNYE